MSRIVMAGRTPLAPSDIDSMTLELYRLYAAATLNGSSVLKSFDFARNADGASGPYIGGRTGYALNLYNSGGTTAEVVVESGYVGIWAGASEQVRVLAGTLRPATDNTISSGTAAYRWSTVYAGTPNISTSDAREKTSVRALSAAELAASKALAAELGAFKFLSAIAAKGESAARLHIGMTVQRAVEIMTAHGLDPWAYGFICYDEWPAEVDESGTVTRPAGSLYSFRPEELLLFLARGFDARLAALEAAA